MGHYDTGACARIDSQAVSGLSGVKDSLAYKTAEIERHLHHYERGIGLAGTPSGETHRADSFIDIPEPFQIDGGNETWGSWVQVLGSSDTPFKSGSQYFDIHKIAVVAYERQTTTYLLQFIKGESSEIAAKLTAGEYTDTIIKTGTAIGNIDANDLGNVRYEVGDKVWARCIAKGQNTGTIDFYLVLHEYEG